VANTISGSGSVSKAGASTLVLTGNNSYEGDTVIDAGTLQVGNGGTTGSLGTGKVVNNGTLAFNRSDTLAVASAIDGTGALVQAGPGTTVLTGTSNYAGGTTIDAGTLQIGDGHTTGTLAPGSVSVNNKGTLAFNRGDDITVAHTITGTGSLAQLGGGITTLTGNNTYGGGTTIEAGTLQVGDGGTTGSLGRGNIVDNGMLAFNRSDIYAVPDAISGGGTLAQQGSGKLVLTGDNGGFSGTTVISSGTTLQVGDGNGGFTGSLGTSGISIGDRGALVFNRGGTVTVSGDISGQGSLLQAGPGTTVLTGTGSYAGGTTIDAGTLQIGDGGTNGTLPAGTVTNNGTIAFKRSDAITLDHAITGTGGLTQSGTGTLVLTGDNRYAGTTTISSGTLQVGNGGSTGTLGAGDVGNDGALVFNRSDTVKVANAISGTGSLTQAGAGTLVLTANNSYGGPTAIAAGMLQVGDGGTSGSLGSGSVTNNGTLAFKRSDTLTVNNAIAGTGSLVQAGPGTTVLTGDSTYTGGTTIATGTLQIGDGGTSGNLAAGNVTNNGTLAFNRSDAVTWPTPSPAPAASRRPARPAGADRRQHLQRAHARERGHALGQRLDRRRHHRQQRRHARRHRHGGQHQRRARRHARTGELDRHAHGARQPQLRARLHLPRGGQRGRRGRSRQHGGGRHHLHWRRHGGRAGQRRRLPAQHAIHRPQRRGRHHGQIRRRHDEPRVPRALADLPGQHRGAGPAGQPCGRLRERGAHAQRKGRRAGTSAASPTHPATRWQPG
jgi:autotransporter-associated beta strand protein